MSAKAYLRISLWLGLLAVLHLLLGCTTGCDGTCKRAEPKRYVNVCPCPCCSKLNPNPLVTRLEKSGVQVIQVGDDLGFIIPSDRLFVKNTPVIASAYYCVLDQIAWFICGIEKINVKVAGYTDDTHCTARNLALSRDQAQAVANYLWLKGSNARVLYAVGCGESTPIASNETVAGRSMNRRIQISLRKITDDYDH